MGITKREIAAELGVSKRTIANYIGKLGLGNHVSRNGNTDILDDFFIGEMSEMPDVLPYTVSSGSGCKIKSLIK